MAAPPGRPRPPGRRASARGVDAPRRACPGRPRCSSAPGTTRAPAFAAGRTGRSITAQEPAKPVIARRRGDSGTESARCGPRGRMPPSGPPSSAPAKMCQSCHVRPVSTYRTAHGWDQVGQREGAAGFEHARTAGGAGRDAAHDAGRGRGGAHRHARRRARGGRHRPDGRRQLRAAQARRAGRPRQDQRDPRLAVPGRTRAARRRTHPRAHGAPRLRRAHPGARRRRAGPRDPRTSATPAPSAATSPPPPPPGTPCPCWPPWRRR